MLGKVASVASYFKCLEVYIIKRYPGAKLPLWAMVATYCFTYFYLSRWVLWHRTRKLKQLRLDETNDPHLCPFPGYWSFNRNYYYNPYSDKYSAKTAKCPITGRSAPSV